MISGKIKIIGIIIGLLVSGCTSKKEDYTSKSGQYFIKNFGENLRTIDRTSNTNNKDDISLEYNHEYRYGNIPYTWGNEKLDVKRLNISSSKKDIIISNSPIFTTHGALLMNDYGNIFLLNKSNQKILWKKNFFSETNLKVGKMQDAVCANLSLAVSEDSVIATCGTDIIKAFKISDGTLLWEKVVDSPINSAPVIAKLDTHNIAILQGKNHSLYALDISSGEFLWMIPGISDDVSKSITANKLIKIDTDLNGKSVEAIVQHLPCSILRLINITNGEILWSIALPVPKKYVKGAEMVTDFNEMAFDEKNQTLYTPIGDGNVAAVEIGKNKPKWIKPFLVTKPLWIIGDNLYAISNVGNVMSTHKNGEIIWIKNVVQEKETKNYRKKEYDSITFTPPVVIGNRVVVISSNGKLIILNRFSGEIIDTYKIGREVFGYPLVYDGKIYILTNNGGTLLTLSGKDQ